MESNLTEIDNICGKFNSSFSLKTALELLDATKGNLHNYFYNNFLSIFPNSFELLERNTEDNFKKLISLDLDEEKSKRVNEKYINSLTQPLLDKYTFYNQELVDKIKNRRYNEFPLITFSITTCKRFPLFTQTMNSFINCCLDIDKIDRWLCVDDNSSTEDRIEMKRLYPFFEFIFKGESDKGHVKSMNIIREKAKTLYLFHMEDDWKFFIQDNYLSNCLDVINEGKVEQCLINKSYAETICDFDLFVGKQEKTITGKRYYIHTYISDTEELKRVTNGKRQCAYWPHYSLRPSLLLTKIFKELGEYSPVSHFEMDYSYRYYTKGFRSGYLEGIYSLHIGRLTSERFNKDKPNAYDLNSVNQFGEVKTELSINLSTLVVNLDRREDRYKKFMSQDNLKGLNCVRFSAIDGNKVKITRRLQRLFEGNDYNWRKGMIGCALSHIQIWINFLKSETTDFLLVLEDDAVLTKNFNDKIKEIIKNEKQITNWSVIMVGYHVFPKYRHEIRKDQDKINLERWNRLLSLTKSMGGTFGYIINKKGAREMLEYINKFGMSNGIDTVMQKAMDDIPTYYCNPPLVTSECWIGSNNDLDTDITFNYDNLKVPFEKRIEDEKKFFSDVEISESSLSNGVYFQFSDNPDIIRNPITNLSSNLSYSIDDRCRIYVSKETVEKLGRDNIVLDRLKNKDGEFEIDY